MSDARKVFDLAALDRQTGGDRTLGLEIVQMFLEDHEMRLAAIRAAVERGDAQGVTTTAHTLKGAAAYLSAAFVVESASRLETIGREGRVADAAAELERLDGAVAQLIPELRKATSS
jgi:HPt (histidine-containing phosphotransfer) domain-containing protein